MVFSDCGQCSGGPSGVALQFSARSRSPTSPPPERKSWAGVAANAGRRVECLRPNEAPGRLVEGNESNKRDPSCRVGESRIALVRAKPRALEHPPCQRLRSSLEPIGSL